MPQGIGKLNYRRETMATHYLNTPLGETEVSRLRAGDVVYLSGRIYTARDAAHKRLMEAISKYQPLPFDIKGQVIYYVGPCPNKPGSVIGSAGPTTSGRMDIYTPVLLDLGLRAMIGKGERNQDVKNSMKRNKAVYLGAIGGTGALISKTITQSKIIAYDDLGTEAIRELTVVNMPLIVIIDSQGNNLYVTQRQKYKNYRLQSE